MCADFEEWLFGSNTSSKISFQQVTTSPRLSFFIFKMGSWEVDMITYL